jgi:hypothetical protein
LTNGAEAGLKSEYVHVIYMRMKKTLFGWYNLLDNRVEMLYLKVISTVNYEKDPYYRG